MDGTTLFLGLPVAVWLALIAQFGAIVGAVITGYVTLRKDMRLTAASIQQHTDVTVQKLNGMLTAVLHSMDRPAWIKVARHSHDGTIRFIMFEVNDAYSDVFGIDRDTYIGKTDLEAGWDRETASLFYENDLRVWASGKPSTFTETINNRAMRFRKVRLESRDGKLKGVMGYAIDCGHYDSCPLYSAAFVDLVGQEKADEIIDKYNNNDDYRSTLDSEVRRLRK